MALSLWQKELARPRLLALARRWGIAALGVALLLALAARLDLGLPLWATVGIPCALFAAGPVLLGRRRPSQVEVARLLDRQLGLNEQAATAVELLDSWPPRSLLAPQVLARATALLNQARRSWRAGPSPAWREWLAVAALLAALLLTVLAPKGTLTAARHGREPGGVQQGRVSLPARTRPSVRISIQVVSTPAVTSRSRAVARSPGPRQTRSGQGSHAGGTGRYGRGRGTSQRGGLSGRGSGTGARGALAGRKLPTGTAKSFSLPGLRSSPHSAKIPPSAAVYGGKLRPVTAGQRRSVSKAPGGLSTTGSSRRQPGHISTARRPGRNPHGRSGVAVGKASLAGSSRSPGGRGAGTARAGTRAASSRSRLRPPRRGHLITLRSQGGTARGTSAARTSLASPGRKEQRTTASGSHGSAGAVDYVAPSANLVPPGDRATISRYFSP